MAEYSFRSDPRIGDWERDKLREFCSSLESDTIALVQSFGLKVFEEDLLPYERGYLENAPSYRTSSGWIIKVNRSDRVETKNFTVAHELGHFVLHKAHLASRDVFDGRMKRDTQNGLDPFTYLDEKDRLLEREANKFAALLLMPPNLFKPAFARLGGDIRLLSKLFFVSEKAIELRVRELGLSG
jgi:Zn-dependent peptidase ImmA (M78 family)